MVPRLRSLLTRTVEGGTTALPLRLTPELGVCRRTDDLAASGRAHLPPGGEVWSLTAHEHVPEEVLQARLAGRTAGVDMPHWHSGLDGALISGVHVCRIPDALYAPGFGAVITAAGDVLQSSVAEALYLTPTLAAFPGVAIGEDGPVMAVPRRLKRLRHPLAVFMTWGGIFNYGHFLLDCLSSLAAVESAGLLDHLPVAPPLNDWQQQALALYLGKARAGRVVQRREPLLRLDDVAFASPMNHFLHAPGRPLDLVRERMLANADELPTGLSRLYISRRGDTKRHLRNEDQLEAALEARGFEIIRPETLPLSRQIALFRDADVIVAPTGAALANTLFCKPNAKVVEIQPSNFTGIWTRGVCHFVGADWHGYFVASPLQETDVRLEGELRPGMLFEWEIPVADFIGFLESC